MTSEEEKLNIDLDKAVYLIERGYTFKPLDQVLQRITKERLKREEDYKGV